ncbi:hypothetical protein DL771_011607 [Monosporascus sp. 5C6A]|nr:hypothetical protein DL771_011607 [Monosporascus sp. 5C6A]
MPFTYPPLPETDSLRLLTLEPGDFHDPLAGTITAVAFSAKPKYVALSYTWGDPNPEQRQFPVAFTTGLIASKEEDTPATIGLTSCSTETTICLNGQSLPITHNLALALLYLRSPTYALTIWVDAICIDQANIAERNAQVALMAFIYTRAAAVVAWLGMPDIFPPSLRDPLEQAGGMKTCWETDNSKSIAETFANYFKPSMKGRSTGKGAQELEKLLKITSYGSAGEVDSMYWERLWIVQEVCLARTVIFVHGGSVWLADETAIPSATINGHRTTAAVNALLEARRARFTDMMSLDALIERFAGQRCNEARDKIFGLIGLANDVDLSPSKTGTKDSGSLHIDYEMGFYDLWRDVTRLMYKDKGPTCVDRVIGIKMPLYEGASRIVRLAGIVQHALEGEVEKELLENPEIAERVGEDDPLKESLAAGNSIFVLGYLAGQILVAHGPSYSSFVSSSRDQRSWNTSFRRYYTDEQDLAKLRAMEATYSAKIIDYEATDLSRITSLDTSAFIAAPAFGGKWSIMARDGLFQERARSWKQARVAGEPRPEAHRFLGTNHCMGLAPAETEVGDWVVRFKGCDAAIVVRKITDEQIVHGDEEGPYYTLVGRADVADSEEGHWLGKSKRDILDILMDWPTLQHITASIETWEQVFSYISNVAETLVC